MIRGSTATHLFRISLIVNDLSMSRDVQVRVSGESGCGRVAEVIGNEIEFS